MRFSHRVVTFATVAAMMLAAVEAREPRGVREAQAAPVQPPATPLVIAHRGASGYLPEHTLAAYHLAIQQGADYIEPDLVMTRDGVLIARHENEIGGTTDVAERPEFAGRRTKKIIDGATLEGWFTEDFTLREIKTLRARERIAKLRPSSARFDGQFEIPTFDEVLDLIEGANALRARAAEARKLPAPRPIGIYPETKHPGYFDGIELSLEEPLVRALHARGYVARESPVYIQSFEAGNLRELAAMTKLPLIQLLATRPADLADIATYAHGIGVEKSLMIPRNTAGRLALPTSLIRDARAAGLEVHGWTFRAENAFLPVEYKRGEDPAAHGDLAGEIAAYLAAGMDGFFTDHPDIGVSASRQTPGQ